MTTARLLQMHIGAAARYQGRPLHEALVDKCRELGLSGASVFHGLEGTVVLTVDSEERIAAAAPQLESMLETGTIAIEDVRVRRIRRG